MAGGKKFVTAARSFIKLKLKIFPDAINEAL
jgi:hypothetical protein